MVRVKIFYQVFNYSIPAVVLGLVARTLLAVRRLRR